MFSRVIRRARGVEIKSVARGLGEGVAKQQRGSHAGSFESLTGFVPGKTIRAREENRSSTHRRLLEIEIETHRTRISQFAAVLLALEVVPWTLSRPPRPPRQVFSQFIVIRYFLRTERAADLVATSLKKKKKKNKTRYLIHGRFFFPLNFVF